VASRGVTQRVTQVWPGSDPGLDPGLDPGFATLGPHTELRHVVAPDDCALHVGSKFCLYEFTELNFLSIGSQLPPRTLKTLID